MLLQRILSSNTRFVSSLANSLQSYKQFRGLSSLFVNQTKYSRIHRSGWNTRVDVVSAYLFRRLFHRLEKADPKRGAIMKLECEEFRSIFTPELLKLKELFDKYNYEIRIAGGAVRDLLSGIKPHDLDFATPATPEQMKKMFETEQVRMINNKGEKHGTITPRINDTENFEITTLRVDKVTDGRHAIVEFTTDWLLDAGRRDLTINSMFLGLDGTVYDFFNGHEDLKKRRVVFVGIPSERIREDYLRILRYFRFYGRISDKADNHDANILQAIRENRSGLAKISGERLWMELVKILNGNYKQELMLKIIDLELTPYLGMGDKKDLDIDFFKKSCRVCETHSLKPITLVASLFKDQSQFTDFHARMKLSAAERDLGLFIIFKKSIAMEKQDFTVDENGMKDFKYLLVNSPTVINSMRASILEWFKLIELPESQRLEFESWRPPRLPITGTHLLALEVRRGRMVGIVLDRLRKRWADSDFQLTLTDLQKLVPEVLEEIQDELSTSHREKKPKIHRSASASTLS